MTCEDCIHYGVCLFHLTNEEYKKCVHFKPKTRYIVLPCAVGDTVYVLEPCVCYNNYSEYEHCNHRRTKATKWLKMVRLPSKHHTRCMKLFIRPFKLEHINKLGKTVFLTKEEAEKTLENKQL